MNPCFLNILKEDVYKRQASQSPEVLEQLIKNGMNVARLNFSHGSHEEHLEKIKTIKRIRRKLNVPLGLMLDTKGPEIRIGKFEEKEYFLKPDDIFTLTTRNIVGNKDIVSVSYEDLPQDVEKGSIISVDDGLIPVSYTHLFEIANDFKNLVYDNLLKLIPYFIKEGKNSISIGFGCTGGQHRSVYMLSLIHIWFKCNYKKINGFRY